MTAHAVGRSRLRGTSPLNRSPRRGRVVRRLVSVGIVAGVIALPTTPSFASPTSTHSTVDPLAGTTGPVVVDVNGNGYVAWDDPSAGGQADRVLFCKIPEAQTCTHKVTLALPGKSTDNVDGIVQPFPMLGAVPGVVYVVGPRYVRGDVVVWTSHNGGSNFSGGVVIPSPSYADGTDVGDVLRSPLIRSIDYFSIASTNIALGYTFTGLGTIGARNPPLGFTFDTSAVAGPVAAATLGFSGQQTIQAFWADGDTPTVDYYWAPTSGVSGAPGSFEHGPTRVSDGVNVRLAGGPKGLFLLSEDGSRAGKSWRLNVRKWDGLTHTFGALTFIASVPNDVHGTNEGGFGEDTSTGALYVGWPRRDASGNYVMDLWTSASGGTVFSGPTSVGRIAGAYQGPARLAIAGGHGFLTFLDGGGLHLVDLADL
jgi:hypothetical protein